MIKSEKTIPSIFTWTFEPEDVGTRVTVLAEYEFPGALLGKFDEPLVQKFKRERGRYHSGQPESPDGNPGRLNHLATM